MEIDKLIEEFNKYINNFDKGKMEISLKYHHSFAVMDLMEKLANDLKLDKNQLKIAKIIGLLHDIGRFEQIKKCGELPLTEKNYDHADESCNYLFKDNHIRDFISDDSYDQIIEKAIRYHNKIGIPNNLTSEEELFCKMIRDMDKVDIYKQLAIHYEEEFNADDIDKDILKIFSKEEQIDRNCVKNKSEQILLHLGFIFDINFEESFDILVDTDNFELYLSSIDIKPNSEKLWKKIKEICYDKINRGLKRKED